MVVGFLRYECISMCECVCVGVLVLAGALTLKLVECICNISFIQTWKAFTWRPYHFDVPFRETSDRAFYVDSTHFDTHIQHICV